MANGDLSHFTLVVDTRHPVLKDVYNKQTHRYSEEYVNAERGYFVGCDARSSLPTASGVALAPNLGIPGAEDLFRFDSILDPIVVEPVGDPVQPPNLDVPQEVVSYTWRYELISNSSISETVTNRRSDFPFTNTPSLMAFNIFNVPEQGNYRFSLVVNFEDGEPQSHVEEFRIRDRLIVSIGESYASGEGNPDQSGNTSNLDDIAAHVLSELGNIPILGAAFDFINTFNSGKEFCDEASFVQAVRGLVDWVEEVEDNPWVNIFAAGTVTNEALQSLGDLQDWSSQRTVGNDVIWQEPEAHRSYRSGPSLAAQRLENPENGDVATFISFARSGAKIPQGILGPREEDPPWNPLGQIQEVLQATRDRPIDAILLSAGGNDVGFAPGLKDLVKGDGFIWALAGGGVSRDEVEDSVREKLAALPERYEELNLAIQTLGVPPERVFITEYPESLFDDPQASAGVNGLCGVFSGPGDLDMDTQDAQLVKELNIELNNQVRAAAEAHGWTLVEGIPEGFAGRGYCSANPLYVSAEEACLRQGDFEGIMHPTFEGHSIYADRIAEKVRPILFPVSIADIIGGQQAPDIDQVTAEPPASDSEDDSSSGSPLQGGNIGQQDAPDVGPLTGGSSSSSSGGVTG